MLTVAELKERGIRPRKGLGQNFLVDEGAVTNIIKSAAISENDTVVEVGPGPGILTPGLAERAGNVIAVETDAMLIPALETELADFKNTQIRHDDILMVDPKEFPAGYKVVANVPYYITSAIIKHFLESDNKPQSMTLTIQAEVADRIVAEPPRMTVLSTSVQLFGEPTIAGRIKRTSFWPAPDVDSAILNIDDIGKNLEQTLDGLSEQDFFKVVKAGFGSKRKQLHNSLTHNLGLKAEQVAEALDAAGIDPKRRAETLTIPEWVTLGKHVFPR